ncbi:491_t:CDS:2, partial [Dentiscutata erythropus]
AQAFIDLWEPILAVSVDLDTWTPEQVDNMTRWGNAKANLYWEANLSNRNPSESNMDSWIRSKYELKRWAMKGPIPDPDTLGDGFSDKPALSTSAKVVSESQISEKTSKKNENILDIFAPSPMSNVLSDNPSSASQLKGADLFSIGQPPLTSNVASNPIQENSNLQSSTPTSKSNEHSNHDVLKSSILSLYNSPNLKPNTLSQSFLGNYSYSSPNLPLRNTNNSTTQNTNKNGDTYMNDRLGGFM